MLQHRALLLRYVPPSYLSRFKYLTSLFNLAKLYCVGRDIL